MRLLLLLLLTREVLRTAIDYCSHDTGMQMCFPTGVSFYFRLTLQLGFLMEL